jgi:hypothetical protein
VVAALERHGYTVRTVTSGDTFARLLVSGPDGMHETEPVKVEMAADWRAHPPVQLVPTCSSRSTSTDATTRRPTASLRTTTAVSAAAIGPVLHLDDAIANKMCALYGRALPRDFLDIDAALASGRYTRERLLKLAADADDGFDPRIFADALGALTQITEAAFAEYDVSPEEITAMRRRYMNWRDELLKP